ncbi:hypothetical protein [Granulosicoccus antarcticus]|uniref:Beta-barrel assembly-enhancing protease n=1 Tax=Granulosicoccus antarcticus IMCC3135 TaxID=1192854 RepID=A0A2Z2NXU8_9GAMM|nr:hypothetical protein [Granulosicoccus antarcticus]ASJ75295.1 hypothetical protein IMCC3135_26200 [Granulosicoccus antarcticus IMCC3135]
MIIRNPAQKRPVHAIAVLCSVLLLGACATTPPAINIDTLPDPVIGAPGGGIARGDTTDAKVAGFWSAAEEARAAGKNSAALEILYQAIDLDPRSPVLWSRAAELQLTGLEAALAESYATKSNAFATDADQALLYRNWLIIEHARKMRGDLLGVRSAHKKVQQYEYR